MTETIERLRQKMKAAAEALDFEEARRLRDVIGLMSGGASANDVCDAGVSGIQRQQPGAMGLGTGHPRVVPPSGWKPPAKPDLGANGPRRRGRGK